MPLKTLFLNPPSFENFDGGAGSRWPATREIESYWYPVWLAYPTGMLEGARLLDAPPHHITAEETIRTCKDYELLVLFTSTPGFVGDVRIAEAIKDSNPHIKIAFVGPHVSVQPEKSLMDSPVIDVVCRKEFDYSIVEYAQGKPLEESLGISYRKNGKVVHKLGLVVHGDFILGLPGESRETIKNTINFAKELDVETIQVSVAHAYPGT